MESSSEVVQPTNGSVNPQSNTDAEKVVVVEDFQENIKNEQQSVEEVKVAINKPSEEDNKTTNVVVTVNLKKEIEQVQTSSDTQNDIEDEVEEIEEEEVEEEDDDGEGDEVEEGTKRTTTKELIGTSDGAQTKTVTTVKKVDPDSAKTVVTTSSVRKQNSSPNANEHAETKETEVLEEETEEEDEQSETVKYAGKQKNMDELQKSDKSCQQFNKDQIPQALETQQLTTVKEETVVDAPSAEPHTNRHDNNIPNKQENFNNTIKDIISSIDSNIQAEENIAALKERELELLKKQHELAKEIEEQKLLAQKLANENHLRQLNNKLINQENIIPSKTCQPITNVSKYTNYEETQDNNVYSRKSEMFETRESTNVSKKIDLNKIFTPATDAEEILPKNRKLYASSAFYSPALHPTVEDQVALARRISHSLSDISNQQSRGQSMYVNRKKRSVKWVHEGCGQDYHQYQQQPRPSTSPNILPAYTDAAKHRVQLNLHQEQLLEKYAKPGLKVVQTPWEAALNSGSASAAFVEEQKLSPYLAPILTPSPTPQMFDASQGGISLRSGPTFSDSYNKSYSTDDYQRYQMTAAPQRQTQHERHYTGNNSARELAYKPSIPQGWKAPSMSLPKDLYMPKEIPLQSYAPPPVAAIPSSASPYSLQTGYDTNQFSMYTPLNVEGNSLPESMPAMTKSHGGNSTFPVSKPYQPGFLATYGNTQPPKQQYLPPQSYQKVPQNSNQNIGQVNFNPSPLPYDKLAKFENPPTDDDRYINSHPSRISHLNVRGNKIRNLSPAPFAGSYNRPYTPSSESHYYGGASSVSPGPMPTNQQYSGHNTPNLSDPYVSSNRILNAPSYNTSARGWGCSGGYQYPPNYISAAPKSQIINVGNMPYTDF